MNNNPENNGNIDDILDILQKKKSDDIKNNDYSDNTPTRVDTDAAKKPAEKKDVQEKSTSKPKTYSPEISDGGISLDDFDALVEKRPAAKRKKKKKKKAMPGYAKVLIYLFVVVAISVLISVSFIKIANDVFAFVKQDKEITVTIEEGASLSDVATILEEKGVIKYSTIYSIYSHLRMDGKGYYTGNFIAGEHVLNSSLGYDKLISRLAESKYSTEIVRVTIPEGFTVYEIIDLFVEKRVMNKSSVEQFKEKLNTAAYEYDFLKDYNEAKDENGKIESDKFYLLEGYLFPDTYDFYVGENLDSVITKLLNNFNRKFDEAYYTRCEELGLTIDEIVTLASMIEAEGNNSEDFYKISSVFHNRLNNAASYPFLDSDATTLYSYQGEKKQLEVGDNKSRVHPFNTYLNRGLPPGPICNPGDEAIHAALYPEKTNYYFFYTNSDGETIFSGTFVDHVNAYN